MPGLFWKWKIKVKKKKQTTAEIISLTPHHMAIGKTHESVIHLLNCLMKKAERGELLGLAVAAVEGQNDIVFQIAQGSAQSSLLVSGVAALNYEINRRWSGI